MNKKRLNETIKKIISKNKDNNIKINLMQELLELLQKLENEIMFHKRTSSLDELINFIENYKIKINEISIDKSSQKDYNNIVMNKGDHIGNRS